VVHVDGARHELPGAHGTPVGERYARGAAALDHDALDLRLRLVGAAGGDKGLHQPARQIERAALAELVAGLQVEGADDGAHRARLRQRVSEPRAEQRDLEQHEEPHVLVLEQLLDQVERLAARGREELAAHRRARQEILALALGQRLREPFGDQDLCRDGFCAAVPLTEGRRVASREARDVGGRLVEIAPEHERRAVAVRLAELVARRNVGDLVVET
jgi:hypothetical protein